MKARKHTDRQVVHIIVEVSKVPTNEAENWAVNPGEVAQYLRRLEGKDTDNGWTISQVWLDQ